MTTTDIDTRKYPLSTVMGVFVDYEQADKAIDELRHANFSYERIRVVKRGTGRFVDTLKGLFTGQATMASSTSNDLVQMGMPEYEAHYYQYELDSDHVLVIMNADDRPESAFSIMRQNGAFDINSHLKINATGALLKAEERDEAEVLSDADTARQAFASENTAYEPGSDTTRYPKSEPREPGSDVAPATRYPQAERQTDEASAVSSDLHAGAEQAGHQTPSHA